MVAALGHAGMFDFVLEQYRTTQNAIFGILAICGIVGMLSLELQPRVPLHSGFALGRFAMVSRWVRLQWGTACLFALASMALAALPAVAANYTWNASSGTAWSSAADWVNNAVPIPGSVALFNSSSYTKQPSTGSTAESVGAVWDTGTGPLTISGTSVLTLTGTTVSTSGIGIEMDGGAGGLTISAPLTLGGAQTWLNNSNSGNVLSVSGSVVNGGNLLTVSGSGNTTIAGLVSGTGGLTMSGSGLLTLSRKQYLQRRDDDQLGNRDASPERRSGRFKPDHDRPRGNA